MTWAEISALEVAPGARILKSLMFRLRDNPIDAASDDADLTIPQLERPRVPQCLRTDELDRYTALAVGGGTQYEFITAPRWHLQAFQTAGAFSVLNPGAVARKYFVELWGGGAAGTLNGSNPYGGGSGAYLAFILSVLGTDTVEGTIGAAGAASAGAGGNTIVTKNGATPVATVYGGGRDSGGLTTSRQGGGTPTLSLGSLIRSMAGMDASSAITAQMPGAGMEGASAPFIGGCSGAKQLQTSPVTYHTNPVTACGGIGSYSNAAQNGGVGMALFWYLE